MLAVGRDEADGVLRLKLTQLDAPEQVTIGKFDSRGLPVGERKFSLDNLTHAVRKFSLEKV